LPDVLTLGRLAGIDTATLWKNISAACPALSGLSSGRIPAEGIALDGAAWSKINFSETRLLKFAPVATA
jgi:hypothetical protein